jgi:hypothetical protein
MLYHPGQGISTDAVQRLRNRRLQIEAECGLAAGMLPLEDTSKQWQQILGEGSAKTKKLRCAICTRPLSTHEMMTRHPVCSSCKVNASLPEDLFETLYHERPQTRLFEAGEPAEQAHFLGCFTPSTEALSETDGGSLQWTPPPTPAQVMSTALRKSLDGVWFGDEDTTYSILFSNATHWTCVRREDGEFWLLFLDPKEGLIWWGTDRTHFLDVSEVLSSTEAIVWHDSGNGPGPRPPMQWKRTGHSDESFQRPVRVKRWLKNQKLSKMPCSVQQSFEDDHRDDTPPEDCKKSFVLEGEAKLDHCRQQQLVPKDDLSARAIREVEAQLCRPGNQGYVWINKWKECYASELGTLRHFLESRPDRFKVSPTSNRGYRVSVVGGKSDRHRY